MLISYCDYKDSHYKDMTVYWLPFLCNWKYLERSSLYRIHHPLLQWVYWIHHHPPPVGILNSPPPSSSGYIEFTTTLLQWVYWIHHHPPPVGILNSPPPPPVGILYLATVTYGLINVLSLPGEWLIFVIRAPFQYKDSLFRYWDFHCKDNMVMRPW